MPVALCMQCTDAENEISFPTVKELVEHQRSGHTIMPKVEAEKPVKVAKTADNPPSGTSVPKKQPIILKYKYEGTHDCGNALDTIQVPIEDHAVVVAYCPNCKIQVTEQRVIPIEAQGVKIEKIKK